MRLVLCVFLFTTVVVSGVNAEWDYFNAELQPFQVFDDYVIAVGKDGDNLQTVNASAIVDALKKGKEIRLKFAEIEGEVRFHGEVKKDVYFVFSTFTGVASFSAKFSESGASFRDATFSGEADFRDATFSGEADFYDARFLGKASFLYAEFSGEANFGGARFSGEADFRGATFSGVANFGGARFSGEADFSSATFSGVASFRGARFSGQVDFSSCDFEKKTDFLSCIYSARARIRFGGVTGFSQMQMEWEYDALYDMPYIIEYSQDEIKRRGLKGHLNYDETFYIALIKNYREMGWLSQADDAYYTYRREKRKRRPDSGYRNAELAMLEVSFGYGVKPFMLLRSFLVLWIPFSLYYALCLRYKPNHKLLYEASSGARRFRRSFYDKWWRFLWGLLYSFDTLTPGIELHSLKSLEQSRYQFNEESKWITWVGRVHKFLGWYLLALFFILFGKIWIR